MGKGYFPLLMVIFSFVAFLVVGEEKGDKYLPNDISKHISKVDRGGEIMGHKVNQSKLV